MFRDLKVEVGVRVEVEVKVGARFERKKDGYEFAATDLRRME